MNMTCSPWQNIKTLRWTSLPSLAFTISLSVWVKRRADDYPRKPDKTVICKSACAGHAVAVIAAQGELDFGVLFNSASTE